MVVRPLTEQQRQALRVLARHHQRCPRCHGTGKMRVAGDVKGNVVSYIEARCTRCGGSGQSPPIPLPRGYRAPRGAR